MLFLTVNCSYLWIVLICEVWFLVSNLHFKISPFCFSELKRGGWTGQKQKPCELKWLKAKKPALLYHQNDYMFCETSLSHFSLVSVCVCVCVYVHSDYILVSLCIYFMLQKCLWEVKRLNTGIKLCVSTILLSTFVSDNTKWQANYQEHLEQTKANSCPVLSYHL